MTQPLKPKGKNFEMSVIEFPTKPEKPWMKPQDDFEQDAHDFVSNSPAALDLVHRLQSCASPFIRAAIIMAACNSLDVPFLLRIAKLNDFALQIKDD
jgi:hypothetical protein